MNRFDHFVKETLKVSGYIRYVDDFVLFGKDKQQLQIWKEAITQELAKLRIIPHPNKTQIHQVAKGCPFLGFRIFPCYKFVNKAKTNRYRRHLRQLLVERSRGHLQPQQLEDGLNAWLGHIRFGQHERLEKNIFCYLCEQGVNLFKHPGGSWRVLEQQR